MMAPRYGVAVFTVVFAALAPSACGSDSNTDGDSPATEEPALAGDPPGRSDEGFGIAPQFATGATRSTPETLWRCTGESDDVDVFHFGADGGGTLDAGDASAPVPVEWLVTDRDIDVTIAADAARLRLTEIEFESPVRFSTLLRSGPTPYAERSCALHDLDGTVLAEPPYHTPYGPASYDRASPPLGASTPSALSMVMIYELGVDGFGTTTFERSAIMTFDDGSFSRDVAGVLLRGVEGSRDARQADWGDWRGDAAGGSIELREDDRDFEELSAVEGFVGQSEQRFEGCYESVGFVSAPGSDIATTTDAFSSNVYCFFADGVFSNRRVSSTVSPELIAGASSDSAGYYRIEGNAIDLEFGNGTVVRHVFGQYGADGKPRLAISLDDVVLVELPSG